MPKKAIATLAAIVINIVMVNDSTNRGEKVFNAYIIGSIRFELLVGDWCDRLGSAVLFLLFCCQS